MTPLCEAEWRRVVTGEASRIRPREHSSFSVHPSYGHSANEWMNEWMNEGRNAAKWMKCWLARIRYPVWSDSVTSSSSPEEDKARSLWTCTDLKFYFGAVTSRRTADPKWTCVSLQNPLRKRALPSGHDHIFTLVKRRHHIHDIWCQAFHSFGWTRVWSLENCNVLDSTKVTHRKKNQSRLGDQPVSHTSQEAG